MGPCCTGDVCARMLIPLPDLALRSTILRAHYTSPGTQVVLDTSSSLAVRTHIGRSIYPAAIVWSGGVELS